MTDMDTLIERLNAVAGPVRMNNGSWSDIAHEAATALRQALVERDMALEAEDEAKDSFWAVYPAYLELTGHGISTEAARTELANRALVAEAQITRLTAALSEETEACAKLRARIEKFESIDIPVAFTGTIGPLTREGRVAIIVLEPPVLGCRYAVVRTETRGLIDLLMQFDGLTNLVGLPVEGEGFPGPDALLAAAIRSRKDKP